MNGCLANICESPKVGRSSAQSGDWSEAGVNGALTEGKHLARHWRGRGIKPQA